ncbi:hypothetical protein [Psychrobacillus lasiicapitis]|uniref:Uncharacterized protein n=1 Tax=Psychrobacillus lasiicapitis TaxID=1636719 RepID=A0A544TAS8_9BACI|nr:hypothetical protein [Psychrobacillus lasiicapitis]TQR14496.1 hypothetical protein FG382_08550 [Psychrobacillus lasiicapitis]GGA30845.1 hypothetical protein GCM10011384_20420 [Psychrobacillus lasiicapitis]
MALGNRKDLFWIFALILLIVAPFACILTPVITSITFYSGPGSIVFVPLSTSFLALAFSFVFAVVLLCASYFLKSNMLKVITVIVAAIGFILIFALGVQNYVYLHEDKIEFNPLFGNKVVHDWENLAKVVHVLEEPEEKQDEIYIFEFTDGDVFEFPVSGVVNGSVQSAIYHKARQYDIPFED